MSQDTSYSYLSLHEHKTLKLFFFYYLLHAVYEINLIYFIEFQIH